jgi:hypothetical protein
VFGCPGSWWQFKRTVETPSGPFGIEIASCSPHRKHAHGARRIVDVISIIDELIPAADSARDLCPSEMFQLCATPTSRILPLRSINTSRCSNITTYRYAQHFFVLVHFTTNLFNIANNHNVFDSSLPAGSGAGGDLRADRASSQPSTTRGRPQELNPRRTAAPRGCGRAPPAPAPPPAPSDGSVASDPLEVLFVKNFMVLSEGL